MGILSSFSLPPASHDDLRKKAGGRTFACPGSAGWENPNSEIQTSEEAGDPPRPAAADIQEPGAM